MILGTTRIRTDSRSGPWALIRHVFEGRGNDEIRIVHGSRADVVAAYEDARAAGRTYAVRHLHISPEIETAPEQFAEILALHAQEWGYNAADAVVVEHQKARQGGEGYERHRHVMVPELRADGRVLDSKLIFKRNEFIARLSEIRLNHPITSGRHNKFAESALEQRGLHDEAARLRAAVGWAGFGPAQSRPESSFSAAQHQIAKRSGISLPALKEVVCVITQTTSDPETHLNFIDTLHALGIELTPGRKAGVWIVSCDGVEAPLHRLLKIRAQEADEMARTTVRAPAWSKATGGYDALSNQNQKRAEASFAAFKTQYESRYSTEYPHGLEGYVQYAQQQQARHAAAGRIEDHPDDRPEPVNPAPAPATPSQPTALRLPEDPEALRRLIGESPWSPRNRDPEALTAAYTEQAAGQRASLEKDMERAGQAIERNQPHTIVAHPDFRDKINHLIKRAMVAMSNVVRAIFGRPPLEMPPLTGRVAGSHPGDPRQVEAAQARLEKASDALERLSTPDVIAARAAQLAAERQSQHDDWMSKTAPARTRLAEIEARQEAERQEQERRAAVEEARRAQMVAEAERVTVPGADDRPDLGPDIDLDEPRRPSVG